MRASADHIVLGSIHIQFYIIYSVYIIYAIYQKVKLVVVFAEHFSHLAMIILRVLLQKSVWFYHQFQFSGKNTQLSSVWLLHECNNFSHQNIRVEDNFYFCTENHKPNLYIVLEKLDHLCIFSHMKNKIITVEKTCKNFYYIYF